MITRGSGEIEWYSYDLPSRIDDLTDSSYTDFWYGPDRSRIKQYQSASGATIRYAGTLFEFEDAATDTYRHYVQAGDKVIAVVERVGTTNTRQYLHRDHQGSVVKVTDASGAVAQALAFDAWGLRRDASDWSALGSPFAGSHETERGYTGHEHLDTVGLIHMNGRVQDPVLGRFISADPLIQAPYSTQSHNRYSYVLNNPGTWKDPSGFSCEDHPGIDCIDVIGQRPPAHCDQTCAEGIWAQILFRQSLRGTQFDGWDQLLGIGLSIGDSLPMGQRSSGPTYVVTPIPWDERQSYLDEAKELVGRRIAETDRFSTPELQSRYQRLYDNWDFEISDAPVTGFNALTNGNRTTLYADQLFVQRALRTSNGGLRPESRRRITERIADTMAHELRHRTPLNRSLGNVTSVAESLVNPAAWADAPFEQDANRFAETLLSVPRSGVVGDF